MISHARKNVSACGGPESQDFGTDRITADDWAEEANRQAAELTGAPGHGGSVSLPSLFAEFRRKLASGEAVSRALARLAEALRFCGRITITFHQGKITKTVCEESYFGGGAKM